MNKSTITIQFTSFLFLWRREAGYKMKLVRQVRADLESNGEWVTDLHFNLYYSLAMALLSP